MFAEARCTVRTRLHVTNAISLAFTETITTAVSWSAAAATPQLAIIIYTSLTESLGLIYLSFLINQQWLIAKLPSCQMQEYSDNFSTVHGHILDNNGRKQWRSKQHYCLSSTSKTVILFDVMVKGPDIYIYRHLQGNPNSSSLQFEVAYSPALAVGGAAQ